MGYFFAYSEYLTSLNLSNFNTSSVVFMDNMFRGCSSLLSINLSNFDTSNVISVDNLFKDDEYLMYIDISNFGHLDYRTSFNNIYFGGIIWANENIVLDIVGNIPRGKMVKY